MQPLTRDTGTESGRTVGSGQREELAERVGRIIREDGAIQPLPGLHLTRASAPSGLLHSLATPVFCVIAQGSKEVLLGDEMFRYDPAHYFITTVAVPIAGQVTLASPNAPYLSLRLDLDPTLVGSVMVEAGVVAQPTRSDVRAVDVSPLDAGLLGAVVRLVSLVDTPADARYLAPLVTREIVYRLLRGDQASRLRHLAVQDGSSLRIAPAIDRLRREFDRQLGVAEVARDIGMSVSSFHHHFKAVTAMSPLQFQKQLRLQEARRLMLGEGYDATTAGYRVGYGDASQFSREYRRMFGEPPMRDVTRLRQTVTMNTGI